MKSPASRPWTAGLILLGLGLLLLAVNFGWLQVDLWTLLWHFWPLVLVLVGLRFLIANPAIYAAAALVLVATAIWAASYAPEPIRNHFNGLNTSEANLQPHQEFDEPLGDDTKRLSFKLDLNATGLNVRELADSTKAYRAKFQNVSHIKEHTDRGSELRVELSQSGSNWFGGRPGGRQAEIALTSRIPVEFEIDSNASKQDLDFSNILLERLKLDAGASSANITFGAKAASLEATIDSGASSLTLRIPKDVGIWIDFDSGLASNNFAEAGLTRDNDTFRSVNFDTQTHKITIRLDAGASAVTLERY